MLLEKEYKESLVTEEKFIKTNYPFYLGKVIYQDVNYYIFRSSCAYWVRDMRNGVVAHCDLEEWYMEDVNAIFVKLQEHCKGFSLYTNNEDYRSFIDKQDVFTKEELQRNNENKILYALDSKYLIIERNIDKW